MCDISIIQTMDSDTREFFEYQFSGLDESNSTKDFFLRAFETYCFYYKKLSIMSDNLKDGVMDSEIEMVTTISNLDIANKLYLKFKELCGFKASSFDITGSYTLDGITFNLDCDPGPELDKIKSAANTILAKFDSQDITTIEIACLANCVEQCMYL